MKSEYMDRHGLRPRDDANNTVIARNVVTWQSTKSRVLDCRASLAMTSQKRLDCRASLAMTSQKRMDCRASLAMTGSGSRSVCGIWPDTGGSQ
ncbi:MAG: hypothetical protein WA012_03940 [Rhodoferax sp.]|uniref:hypothetical protein n=1 Tax=Rhodoferax sp. TaxID=50421 RepID=UPI003BB11F5A